MCKTNFFIYEKTLTQSRSTDRIQRIHQNNHKA